VVDAVALFVLEVVGDVEDVGVVDEEGLDDEDEDGVVEDVKD
jgi:hypothetical protein